MTESAIDAVLFDWAGTLTPFHEIDVLAHWVATARAGGVGDPEAVGGRLFEAEKRVMTEVRGTWRAATIEDVFDAAGVTAREPMLEQYLTEWEAHTHTIPEAAPLFATIRDFGIKVGIVSNTLWSRSWHDRIFRRDGILDHIDVAIYSSELGYVKPHPRPFEVAMAELGVSDAGRCLFVGDRLHEDVWGSGSVGMRTVFVPHSTIPAIERSDTEATPDHVIEHLTDVLDVLTA